jgi:hypothetical protein
MSRGLLQYAVWCLLLLGLAAWGGFNAVDPFADGGSHHSGPGDHSGQHRSGGGGFWFFGGGGYGGGPAHK